MRIFVLILGILGAIGSGLFGWTMRARVRGLEFLEMLEGPGGFFFRERILSYLLLAAFPLGIAAGLLAANRKRWLAAPLFLLSTAGPLVLLIWQWSSVT